MLNRKNLRLSANLDSISVEGSLQTAPDRTRPFVLIHLHIFHPLLYCRSVLSKLNGSLHRQQKLHFQFDTCSIYICNNGKVDRSFHWHVTNWVTNVFIRVHFRCMDMSALLPFSDRSEADSVFRSLRRNQWMNVDKDCHCNRNVLLSSENLIM